jgi:AAHS family benzoate transporter-like MFS transporter
VGFASGIGRLGAIVAPVLIGALVAMKLPLEQNFLAIGFAGLVGTLAVMLIDHRQSASVQPSQEASLSSLGVHASTNR